MVVVITQLRRNNEGHWDNRVSLEDGFKIREQS